jgi:hypothetical protein
MTKKAKPKTQEQKDQATDKRLLKGYGRGLDWYNQQLKKQNGGCAVCYDGPGTRRLNIDHDHHYVDVKIISEKFKDGWSATATYNGEEYVGFNKKKSLAIRKVKDDLLRESVRGLLCHRCNRALIMLRDKPDLVRKAADYLENFQKGSPLSRQETR